MRSCCAGGPSGPACWWLSSAGHVPCRGAKRHTRACRARGAQPGIPGPGRGGPWQRRPGLGWRGRAEAAGLLLLAWPGVKHGTASTSLQAPVCRAEPGPCSANTQLPIRPCLPVLSAVGPAFPALPTVPPPPFGGACRNPCPPPARCCTCPPSARPPHLLSSSRSSQASLAPVEAPLGTSALKVPCAVTTSASTVGLPRESITWRPCTLIMEAGASFRISLACAREGVGAARGGSEAAG